VHRLPSRWGNGDKRLLHAVQLVQLALQRGDAGRALGQKAAGHYHSPRAVSRPMLALVICEVERKTGITK
jgi:hypothetical protein